MKEEIVKRLKNPDSLVSLLLGVAVVIVLGVLVFRYTTGKQTAAPGAPKEAGKAPAAAQLPATHTVAAGETLWSIAQKYYTSGYNWIDIATASSLTNPDYLEIGQALTVPNVPVRMLEGQISAATMEVQKPKDDKYTVKQGDTLWDISVNVYGTGYRWPDISSTNKLVNPDLIYPETVLVLP